jgi:hypothetical protein
MQTKPTVKSLRERAMLVCLKVSVWEGRRFDASLTNELTARHGAAPDTARVNRHLFGKDVMAPITTARSRARTYFNAKTLVCDEDIWRLMPAVLHAEVTQQMRVFESEFDAAVRSWLARYPEIVEAERARHNGMFDEGMYPAVDCVARRFRMVTDVKPLSDASDFRVKLADDQTRTLVEAIERSTDERIERAMRDTWQRLYAPVADMVQKLREFDLEGDQKRHWVTGRINSNILDVIDLLPRLNVWGDPELARMADAVRDKLTKTDPKTFKDAPDVRLKVIGDAQAILADMAGFVGEA